MTSQPLAFIYLSQIPQTGLALGPFGTALYWTLLVVWSVALAYLVLFSAMPFARRYTNDLAERVSKVVNVQKFTVRHESPATPEVSETEEEPELPRGYSSYDGFKSFAQTGALSVQDIVKGLSSRIQHQVPSIQSPVPKTEPIYENVEPIYENAEAITVSKEEMKEQNVTSTNANSFATALIHGDRTAVFGALRGEIKEGNAPEKLITRTVCLLDDAYRARVDGTPCDPNIARVTARLDTPTLERLITALITAVDSSYSTGITGAKLALTRALAVLGA